jgi:nucleotide-binding universal stress UspA family protein
VGRIVVGVDDSEGARHALAWALAQARSLDAAIEVVHVFERNIAWIDGGQPLEDVRRSEQHALDAARRTLDEIVDDVVGEPPAVPVTRVALLGDVAPSLVEQASTADLLVVGSHGRGGVSGLLLGSVSRRCTELARCPVVVIPRALGQPGS